MRYATHASASSSGAARAFDAEHPPLPRLGEPGSDLASSPPEDRSRRFSPSRLLWILSGAVWIWSLHDCASPAGTVHRIVRTHQWRHATKLRRALEALLFIAGSPIVLMLITRCTFRCGARVKLQTGKGRARQVREQLALWLTRGVMPLSYYSFELYHGPSRARALEFLYRYETKCGAYPMLRSRYSSRATTDALRSKAEFALRCQYYGIAAIPALFVIHRNALRRFDGTHSGLPRRDLFLKPLSGAGGRGAAVWRYTEGAYHNSTGGRLTESELIEHLRLLSENEAHVARPYVLNHPSVADLSPGALSSVRVVTCLDESNRPEATDAVLRMARTPDSVVDNFHAGGIAAHVDLQTGIVGSATDLGLSHDSRWWDTHPVTDATIRGRRLPFWAEILDLVQRAHAVFPDQIVVGWDVAIATDGPQLIEGNKSPDLDIIQRTARAPIGNSRLGVLLAHHLVNAFDEHPRRPQDSNVRRLPQPSGDGRRGQRC